MSPMAGAWQRKEFLLGDQPLSLKIKLWGAAVDLLDDNYLRSSVLVKNLVLDRYEGRNTMASTPETEIIVSNHA